MDIEGIISFLSHHFEVISATFFIFLILVIVLWISLTISQMSIRHVLHVSFRAFLLTTLILGVATLGYLYSLYKKEPTKIVELPLDLLEDTKWVKSNTLIYYIDGNQLNAIRANGENFQVIYWANEPIREYHFSSNGEFILIATLSELYLFNHQENENQLVESVKEINQMQGQKGGINEIRWSPDNDNFSYELAQWSNYTSQNKLYVYNVKTKEKKILNDYERTSISPYWDKEGKYLYLFDFIVQEYLSKENAFEVKVSRIPISTMIVEDVAEFYYDKETLPLELLELRGIELYTKGDQRSFFRFRLQNEWMADSGVELGVDKSDYLYILQKGWFKRRLLKITREVIDDNASRYQYKGGELALREARWLDGDRYIIMDYSPFGILILDPYSMKIGKLISSITNTFGWYD